MRNLLLLAGVLDLFFLLLLTGATNGWAGLLTNALAWSIFLTKVGQISLIAWAMKKRVE